MAESVKKRKLSGDDPVAVALLTAAAEFRSKKERAPVKGDMASLVLSSPGLSHLTPEKAYNKLRHIRDRFLRSAFADSDLLALASRCWDPPPRSTADANGGRGKGEEDEQGEQMDLLKTEAEAYWKENGLSLVQLKMGMDMIDRSKAKALQTKWMTHSVAAMVLKKNNFSLFNQLYAALCAASKG